ncbi:O-methyltransferase family 3 [Cordyceps militaris CM01]|uniref:O-methyltransferase family 3 n=2 Tax=Cordyceps militaris TaxID=73501 RepID=G3JUS8_CORMM|nr:O-methyltransferase family 3 [Cordyceps militaris CM01]ATY59579.1 O-methyltransferase family 3 [Cordyceps militaris]EGX87878.1 O-methyltransferase family 3 [Cordyceps militaris CM01]
MKSANTNALYSNDAVTDSVVDYAAAHSEALPTHISDYHARIVASHPRMDYMISNLQGQFQTFIARAVGAKRVLEIGAFVGYSAMVWAHAVGRDGSVTTLEFKPEYADAARAAFQENGVENVEVIQGDALETLAKLSPEEPYDLVFIDAQKTGYPAYLRTILEKSQPGAGAGRLLRKGGVILADNILRRGLVANDSEENPWAAAGAKDRERSEYEKDNDVEALREFNDLAFKSERLEAFLMPLFDGVGMSMLRD